jgi:hypothetical protein
MTAIAGAGIDPGASVRVLRQVDLLCNETLESIKPHHECPACCGRQCVDRTWWRRRERQR